MSSEPQPFSWPGITEQSNVSSDPAQMPAADPAQAAADAAAAGHQQGFDRGYAEGFSKGEQQAKEQMQQQFANLEAVVAQAQAFSERWRANQVELVQKVAVHLLGETLFANSDRLASLLAQAQQQLPGVQEVSLACHPDRENEVRGLTRFPLILDTSLAPSALELRQEHAILELNIEAVVSEAFAGIDFSVDPVPGEVSENGSNAYVEDVTAP